MPIEVRGPQHLLEELKLFLRDQFIRMGYQEGPKVGSRDAGFTVDFTKGNVIVAVHIRQEDESSLMYVEAEQEVPELADIWDGAIITYCKQVLTQLRSYSVNKSKVDQAFESWVKRPES